jgi:hypothetical protein
MKPYFLLPRVFRPIGFLLLLPGLALGYMVTIQHVALDFLSYGKKRDRNPFIGVSEGNLTDEVALTLTIIGFFFICFARLKNENPWTSKCRLNSLYWSVLIDSLIISMIIIIGTIDDFLKIPALEKVDFLTYLFIYNVFFVPFIFSIRFYYLVKRDHRRERIKMIYHLPYKPFKFIGLFFFIAFILLFAASFAGLSLSSDTVIAFSPCILFLLWSKEKNENKLIQHLRISSMQTA